MIDDQRDYAEEAYVRADAIREAAEEWKHFHGLIVHTHPAVVNGYDHATPDPAALYDYTISSDGGNTYTQCGIIDGLAVEIIGREQIGDRRVIRRFVAVPDDQAADRGVIRRDPSGAWSPPTAFRIYVKDPAGREGFWDFLASIYPTRERAQTAARRMEYLYPVWVVFEIDPRTGVITGTCQQHDTPAHTCAPAHQVAAVAVADDRRFAAMIERQSGRVTA